MKKLVFNECHSEADIRNTILTALGNEVVVANEEEAKDFFKEQELDGNVTTNVIVSTHVSIWNDEMNGEEVYHVIVKEHFVDAGSNDYVYSFHIS